MKKLVVVAGVTKLKLFVAEKHHFTESLPEIDIERDGSHRLLRKESHNRQKFGPDSAYDAHTSPEEIERMESARDISAEIVKVVKEKNIQEIILVAEPKMLGFLRKYMDSSVKKLISDEIGKDYLQVSEKDLPAKIFEKK